MEQVLKVLGKLDEQNIRSIIWVTQHEMYLYNKIINIVKL